MTTYSVHLPILVREAGPAGTVDDEREYAMTLRYDVIAASPDAAAHIIFERLSEVLRDPPA